MSHKNVQYQPPDLSDFLLPPEVILHFGKLLSWERVWGSGQVPSCSMVSFIVQSPPGPGVGYGLLKDHRIWTRDNLSSSMLSKASQEGVGAKGAAVCCSSWVLLALILACPSTSHPLAFPLPHVSLPDRSQHLH